MSHGHYSAYNVYYTLLPRLNACTVFLQCCAQLDSQNRTKLVSRFCGSYLYLHIPMSVYIDPTKYMEKCIIIAMCF